MRHFTTPLVLALALIGCHRSVFLPAGNAEPRCAVKYQWIKPQAFEQVSYDSLLVEVHLCPVFTPKKHRIN